MRRRKVLVRSESGGLISREQHSASQIHIGRVEPRQRGERFHKFGLHQFVRIKLRGWLKRKVQAEYRDEMFYGICIDVYIFGVSWGLIPGYCAWYKMLADLLKMQEHILIQLFRNKFKYLVILGIVRKLVYEYNAVFNNNFNFFCFICCYVCM